MESWHVMADFFQMHMVWRMVLHVCWDFDPRIENREFKGPWDRMKVPMKGLVKIKEAQHVSVLMVFVCI